MLRLARGIDGDELWVEATEDEHGTVAVSAWELDDQERAAIAAGGRVELRVWGGGHPPVALRVEETSS